jgi:hypothetical protein
MGNISRPIEIFPTVSRESSVICVWNGHCLSVSYVVEYTDLHYYFRAIKCVSLKHVVIMLEGTVETGVCL